MFERSHPAWPQTDSSTDDEPKDEELVADIVRGSEAALGVMYDRHAGVIFGTALRLLRDRSEAEEVVQETFLALWNRAEQFTAARGSARIWLLSIARNRCIDRARAARARIQALAFSSVTGGDNEGDAGAEGWLLAAADPIAIGAAPQGPEQAAVDGETRGTISAALATLDEEEREVIVLAYRHQLSQSEIARRLGWPLGTVKTRTRRALHHLRFALDEPAARQEAVVALERMPQLCCGSEA